MLTGLMAASWFILIVIIARVVKNSSNKSGEDK
jgi:hypothetical protein